MAGRVLDLKEAIISEDQLATRIAQYWQEWNTLRADWVHKKEEIRKYVYATSTDDTTNSTLPWKNKTTIPKLCQIRDNLSANYSASIFPKRKWLIWEGADKASNTLDKREAIEAYMAWVLDYRVFKKELHKCIQDYIDYGNCFATVEWVDDTIEVAEDGGRTQVGYIGPSIKRISPLDIVFNPLAASFENSPKITRAWLTLGEVKEFLTRQSKPENAEQYQKLFDYIKGVRDGVQGFTGETKPLDAYYSMDGFSSFVHYLQSDYVELLTFQGDLYNKETDEFYRNHVITVVDRHKVIHKEPNPSYFGAPPIYHVGWRPRQDNLWAMGPLDNLIGLQYRIDHVENLKADVFDLITFPPIKIKGHVENFKWGPMARIYVGDDGDVEMMIPPFQVLEANVEISAIEQRMEEMAGAPKEAMGFRTPGEKTMYEVQRLENAASRIFQNKISQFEEVFVEPLINALLELGKRRMTSSSIRVLDDEFKITTFRQLTSDDITGSGRIKPVAARHFAERAELVQNVNNFFQSALGQDPEMKAHWSTIKLSEMFEEILELQDYNVVQPYVRLSEQADAQRLSQSNQESVAMEAGTPSGLTEDDFTGPDLQTSLG
jgi:hypothetical protein